MKNILTLFGVLIILFSCKTETQDLDKTENVITYNKPLISDFSEVIIKTPRNIPKMSAVSPNGDKITVNSQYLTYNNKPWIPSYGEFHYQRYPAEYWEDALLKMKAQGFDGVSAYVLWILHEEIEGEWDFTGSNDLRRFIKLCQKHDLKFYARIGPWVNGECRNGGHPDWLVKRLGNPKNPFGNSGRGGKLRTMAPEYLASVDILFQKLAEQMKGLYWKYGGPIYAIQLDNEFSHHVSKGSPALMDWEKETAIKYGMDVPLYSVTGWADAPYTQDNTIPSYGSYADYFWIPADAKHVPEAFSFSIYRASNDVNTELSDGAKESEGIQTSYDSNPYLTCETGIGMDMAYHRRTNLDNFDNGALSLVELGSGANGIGYFMNVGGNNPKGKLTYMNRDIESGANDNGVISRDFQAAIGEFGQVRKSFHEYPVQLNFMTDFGEYLAPCKTFVPTELDELKGFKLGQTNKLQRAIRTDGKTGFVFVNNHVKLETAYQFNNIQFKIKLKNETLTIPEKAITVPVDSYFYWPFNLTLQQTTIKYASAQPILHLKESNTYVFFQNEGINAEFALDNTTLETVTANNAKVSKQSETTKIDITQAGLNCYFNVKQKNGETVRFIVLSQKQAKQLYKNNDKLYLSNAEVIKFNNVNNTIEVVSENTQNSVWVYPSNTIVNLATSKDGLFDKFEVNFEKQEVPITIKETQDGKSLTFKNRSNNRKVNNKIARPLDSVWHKGTVVEFSFPKGIPSNLNDVRVIVDYKASALRFYKNGEFKYDNYYNGNKWDLSTKHLLSDYNSDMKLELKFIPLQPKDAIYIDGVYWPDLDKTENVLKVNGITTIPVYSKNYKLK
ncbi:Glycosyl hydrolases family 35 [Lutibacter oricola]|uniref:Glycosyl hydrolases family 35 n=1 Tax=Lutibacter oricola TaxID=762486 RepID=A0A1H2WT82_9FLAO|nr:beta-galactosidase [Lutibacter oricola]SDW83686.1 Glycosyl hydrolases family 35 [Lutibacter oricola]